MDYFSDNVYQERAIYCINQANLTRDDEIKRNWDELAAEWIELSASRASRNGLNS
jgi:hypothetical protein